MRKILINKAKALNRLEAGDQISNLDVIAVPFCLKSAINVPIILKSGDNPTLLVQKNSGLSGLPQIDNFFELNTGAKNGPSVDEFNKQFLIGKSVKLPFASPERMLIPKGASGSELKEIFSAVPITLQAELSQVVRDAYSESAKGFVPEKKFALKAADQFSEIANTAYSNKQTFEEVENQVSNAVQIALRYSPLVQFSSTDDAIACRGTTGVSAHLYEPALLKERLAKELEKRNAFYLNRRNSEAVVGIIDSGLNMRADSNFFQPNLFSINYDEFHRAEGIIDPDNNDHTNDVFGTNFYKYSGVIDPLIKKKFDEYHGTKIASLVLGGPDFHSDLFKEVSPSPILLKIVNFSNDNRNIETESAHKLPAAIDYLEDQGVHIINMSLITSKRIKVLGTTIERYEDTLFVVASGNSKTGRGKNISSIPVYPAFYGGSKSGNGNVVTVGAHNLLKQPARFSNFSRERVDLLAPGCAVPVRGKDGEITKANGTSVATAITSFAAGLVRHLGLRNASEIKNRLLLGTDFDHTLDDYVASSGRLNIVKAISVFSDVVHRDKRPLKFGHVSNKAQIKAYCKSPPADVFASFLRKVVRVPQDGNSAAKLEFWIDSDNTISRAESCEINPDANVAIEIIQEDGELSLIHI